MTHSAQGVLIVSGMLIMGYTVVSMYFMRFWRDTQDRLFMFFALAFALLALQRFALTFAEPGTTGSTWLYLLRLLAFVLIVFAIIDKNRR